MTPGIRAPSRQSLALAFTALNTRSAHHVRSSAVSSCQ